MSAPEPGVYRDVPAEEYHRWPYASNSRLGKLVPPSTPAHLKEYLENGVPERKVFREGRILHACVLEFERYQRDYVVPGQCFAVTGKGTPCSNAGTWPTADGRWLCTQHVGTFERRGDLPEPGDATSVTEADDRMARAVRAAVLAHPKARALVCVPDAEFEVSLVWDDPATGVRCKARMDMYSPSLAGGTVMDLKGVKDASPRGFLKDGFWHGYPRQGVMYLTGCRALGLPASNYAMVAVEKTPPYALTINRITEATLGHLPDADEDAFYYARHVRALLRLWQRCHERDEWPGYTTDVQDFQLEEWQWAALDHQTQAIEELVA